MIACFVLAAVLVKPAQAKDTKNVYVGQGRYVCLGDRSKCRRFEAEERERQGERSYYKERIEQERRRDRDRSR